MSWTFVNADLVQELQLYQPGQSTIEMGHLLAYMEHRRKANRMRAAGVSGMNVDLLILERMDSAAVKQLCKLHRAWLSSKGKKYDPQIWSMAQAQSLPL